MIKYSSILTKQAFIFKPKRSCISWHLININRFVLRHTDNICSGRIVFDTPYLILMLIECMNALHFLFVPYFNRSVRWARHEMVVIGRKSHAQHPRAVATERAGYFSVLHVEHFNVVVIRRRAKYLRVGRERDRSNRHGVSFERMQKLTRLYIEYIYKAIDGPTS